MFKIPWLNCRFISTKPVENKVSNGGVGLGGLDTLCPLRFLFSENKFLSCYTDMFKFTAFKLQLLNYGSGNLLNFRMCKYYIYSNLEESQHFLSYPQGFEFLKLPRLSKLWSHSPYSYPSFPTELLSACQGYSKIQMIRLQRALRLWDTKWFKC